MPDSDQIKAYVTEKRLLDRKPKSQAAYDYWTRAHQYLGKSIELQKKAEPYPSGYWNLAIIESPAVWDRIPDFDSTKKAYLKEAYDCSLRYLEFREKAIRIEAAVSSQTIEGYKKEAIKYTTLELEEIAEWLKNCAQNTNFRTCKGGVTEVVPAGELFIRSESGAIYRKTSDLESIPNSALPGEFVETCTEAGEVFIWRKVAEQEPETKWVPLSKVERRQALAKAKAVYATAEKINTICESIHSMKEVETVVAENLAQMETRLKDLEKPASVTEPLLCRINFYEKCLGTPITDTGFTAGVTGLDFWEVNETSWKRKYLLLNVFLMLPLFL